MLKVKLHVASSEAKRNSGATIKAGQVVALNTSGEAVLCDASTANTSPLNRPLGLAGDTKASLTAGQFTNRVSDYGDETRASGLITVYKDGGEFYVDFTDVISETSVTVGQYLKLDSSNPGKLCAAAMAGGDSIGNNDPTKRIVAQVIDDLSPTNGYLTNPGYINGYLPTGIPNEFEPSGDSDSSTKFCLIKWLA